MELVILSEPTTYLLHSCSNIHKCLCPVYVASYNDKSIVRKQITALETLFGKEVDPFVRCNSGFSFDDAFSEIDD